MTTSESDGRSRTGLQVGDRVHVQRRGRLTPGRILSIHRQDDGVAYVVAVDAADSGLGGVINVWTTSGRSAYLVAAGAGGQPR